MKYIIGLALTLMVSNEIFTLVVLSALMLLFFGDIYKARCGS